MTTTMHITLLDPRLQFISRPRSVMHATATGTHTLCGVAMDEAMTVRGNFLVVDGRLCARCYRSLRTYGPQFVAVECEVAG